MTVQGEISRLVKTKLALVEKYQRLAKASRSRPKQKRLIRQAERLRRQAEDLGHRLKTTT